MIRVNFFKFRITDVKDLTHHTRRRVVKVQSVYIFSHFRRWWGQLVLVVSRGGPGVLEEVVLVFGSLPNAHPEVSVALCEADEVGGSEVTKDL